MMQLTEPQAPASALARFAQRKKANYFKSTALDVAWHIGNSLGSTLYPKPPPATSRLLNLGCGAVKYDGFVNADCYNFFAILKGMHKSPDWMLDATRPWHCKDDYWHGIFCEHMLEHLRYADVTLCLKEAYRTLGPGGFLRLVVPDIDVYVRLYRNEVAPEHAARFPSGPEAISDMTQNWGHVSVWNARLLRQLLEEIGLTEVREVSFGVGSVPLLIQDSPHRAWESCYVEGRKL